MKKIDYIVVHVQQDTKYYVIDLWWKRLFTRLTVNANYVDGKARYTIYKSLGDY